MASSSSLRPRVLSATRSAVARPLDGEGWVRSVVEAATSAGGLGGASSDGTAEDDGTAVEPFKVAEVGETVCDVLLELLADEPLSQDMSALLVSYVSSALRKPSRGRGRALASPQEAVSAILRRCTTAAAPEAANEEGKAVLRALDQFCIGMLNSGRSATLSSASTPLALKRLPSLLDLLQIIALEVPLDKPPSMSMQLAIELMLPICQTICKPPRRRLASADLKPLIDAAVEALMRTLREGEKGAPLPFLVQLDSLLRYISADAARKLAMSESPEAPAPSTLSAIALLASLFLRPGGLASSSELDARLLAFARTRSSQPHERWTAELLTAAVRLGLPPSGAAIQQDEVDVAWAAFIAGGRLVELVSNTRERLQYQDDQRLASQELERTRSLILATPSPLSPNAMQVDGTRSEAFSPTRSAVWSSLLDQLWSANFLDPSASSAALPAAPSSLLGALPFSSALSDIRAALPSPSDASLSALASSAVSAFESAGSSSDLTALCNLASAFSSLDAQRVMILWKPPVAFLAPVAKALDNWGSGSGGDSGAQQSFEQFGALLGWLSSFVFRLNLSPSDFEAHLGTRKGFVASYLLTSSSSYPLAALDSERQRTLSSWIGALYGSEGISDDLLSGTDPRTLVRLAPTLFRQSFEALRKGEVDADAVKEGLSYFEQALLSGCAGSVVGWLVDELERQGPIAPTHQPVLLEILQFMLLSPSVNPLHLEPLAARALRLVRTYASGPPPTLQPSKQPLDVRALVARLTSLGGTFSSTMPIFGGGNAHLASMGWEVGLRTALEAEITPSEGNETQRDRLWSLLPDAPRALGAKRYKEAILDGTVRSCFASPANGVGKIWDAAAYERRDRAVDVAVAALTWDWSEGDGEGSRVAEEFVVEFRWWGGDTGAKGDLAEAELREAEWEVMKRCLEQCDAGIKAAEELGVAPAGKTGAAAAWNAAKTRLRSIEEKEESRQHKKGADTTHDDTL